MTATSPMRLIVTTDRGFREMARTFSEVADPARAAGRRASPGPEAPAPPADLATALEERLVRLDRDLDALIASTEELSRVRC